MFDFMQRGEVSLKDLEKAIQELPLPDKIRALAVYKRYKKIRQIEDKMNAETKALQRSYLKLDAPILETVSNIVQGKKEIVQADLKDLDKYLTAEQTAKAKQHIGARKFNNYWFNVLSNAHIVKQTIGTDDQPLLKAIENIYVVDQQGTDNFTIFFDIAENELISNKQLSKKFFIKNQDPIKTQSTPIEWKGKNLTLKEVKKKQKNKKTGQTRCVTKTVEAKSFFTFFKNIQAAQTGADIESTEQQLKKRQQLDTNFQIGGIIVDQVLPYSLEYFLGCEHEGDQEDYDGDLDEEDQQDDEQQKPKGKKNKSKSKSKQKKGKNKQEKPECKQQ